MEWFSLSENEKSSRSLVNIDGFLYANNGFWEVVDHCSFRGMDKGALDTDCMNIFKELTVVE